MNRKRKNDEKSKNRDCKNTRSSNGNDHNSGHNENDLQQSSCSITVTEHEVSSESGNDSFNTSMQPSIRERTIFGDKKKNQNVVSKPKKTKRTKNSDLQDDRLRKSRKMSRIYSQRNRDKEKRTLEELTKQKRRLEEERIGLEREREGLLTWLEAAVGEKEVLLQENWQLSVLLCLFAAAAADSQRSQR